jgi:hypothetical protein
MRCVQRKASKNLGEPHNLLQSIGPIPTIQVPIF